MKQWKGWAVAAITVALLGGASTLSAASPVSALDRQYGVDLAYKRRVVSSGDADNNLNIYAVDGDKSTRFSANAADDAWFYVNLGSLEKIGKVKIDWEAAYASEYFLQVSQDALTWTTVSDVKKTSSLVDEITFPSWIEAVYVRFQGVKRALSYGYSFYSFEVYGPQSLAEGTTVLSVSSNENATALPMSAMVDDSASSRWASAAADNQYALFDLGESKTFDLIKIRWEVSFARIYDIYANSSTDDVAPTVDDANWTRIAGTEAGLGEVESLPLPEGTAARYLKLSLIQRETSEATKKTGRFPWDSSFSIYSFELFDWSSLPAASEGHEKEFSPSAPAWAAMSDITQYPDLLLAPQGYPKAADGVVTDMASIASGNIPGFESYATYNPAVVYDDANHLFRMIYRTELPDNFAVYYGNKYPLGNMSTLSYAYSTDGKHFTRGGHNPVAWPTTNDEAGGGLEDPRMFKIVNDPARGGITTYYITYTMYDNSTTREGIMWTQDFLTYTKVGRIAPDYGGATKSGTFLTDPEGNAVTIDDPRPGKTGKVYMLYMKDGGYTRLGFTTDVTSIAASDIIDIASTALGSDDIEDYTNGNESCMALTDIYGPGDDDIYLMFGGGRLTDANLQNEFGDVHGWFYALGVLKTTKSNPFELTNLMADVSEPTMYPTDTNKFDYGTFNKCMFADSMIRYNNEWLLYYGAGDMYVGLATSRADFSAAAATYATSGTILTASTKALNKRYGSDRSDYAVEFVSEIRDLDGTILHTEATPYALPHWSHDPLGKYSTGTTINVSTDLNAIADLPSSYDVVSYVRDASTKEELNNESSYLVTSSTLANYSR